MSSKKEEKKAARIERFESACRETEAKGYRRIDCSYPLDGITGRAFLSCLPFAALFAGLYFGLARTFEYSFAAMGITLAACVVGVPVHELLHFFVWGLFGKSFRCVRLGFDQKTLTPYCACTAPMPRWKYLCGSLAPFALLGILPCVLSLVLKNCWLFFFGEIAILLASGDTAVSFKILRAAPRRSLLLDHPERAGAIAFTNKSGRSD